MKNILRSMKLWQKFAALGVISTVMCAIPLTLVVRTKTAELDVAKAEEAGLDPTRHAIAFQQSLQRHRGQSALLLSGTAAADAERRKRQAEVNEHLAALEKLLADPTYASTAAELKDMRSGWEKLSKDVDNHALTPAESFSRHQSLIERNFKLMDLTADASGLSLDPVAETYYVMTALVDHLKLSDSMKLKFLNIFYSLPSSPLSLMTALARRISKRNNYVFSALSHGDAV